MWMWQDRGEISACQQLVAIDFPTPHREGDSGQHSATSSVSPVHGLAVFSDLCPLLHMLLFQSLSCPVIYEEDLCGRYFLITEGFKILFLSSFRFGMTTNCDGIPKNTMELNLFGYRQIKFGNQTLSCTISMMNNFPFYPFTEK